MSAGKEKETIETCIAADGSRSLEFGSAIALSKNFVAIGDPGAHRVFVYRHDSDGNLIGEGVISPPAGSDAEKVGRGFGHDVAVGDGFVVIGSFRAQAEPTMNGPHWIESSTSGQWITGAVYLAPLDGSKPPDQVAAASRDELPGFAVAASGGRYAYSAFRGAPGPGAVGGVVLADGHRARRIAAPSSESVPGFGQAIDLSDRTLLVGAPISVNDGVGWSFDLNNLDRKPTRIQGLPGSTGAAATSVAIGDGWQAVASSVGWGGLQTAIQRFDGTRVTIPFGGRVSGSGPYLAINQPGTPDNERLNALRLYEISEKNQLDLVLQLDKVTASEVNDNTVAFIREKYDQIFVCVQIIL